MQAYDQQQQGLVDAASKALSYRQEVLEENIRLTYALQARDYNRWFAWEHFENILNELLGLVFTCGIDLNQQAFNF